MKTHVPSTPGGTDRFSYLWLALAFVLSLFALNGTWDIDAGVLATAQEKSVTPAIGSEVETGDITRWTDAERSRVDGAGRVKRNQRFVGPLGLKRNRGQPCCHNE